MHQMSLKDLFPVSHHKLVHTTIWFSEQKQNLCLGEMLLLDILTMYSSLAYVNCKMLSFLLEQMQRKRTIEFRETNPHFFVCALFVH